MELSQKGAAFVRVHEGFVARWYRDPVGIPTIGVGFTWRSNSFREWWAKNKPGVKFAAGARMTRQEADDALRYLMSREYGLAVNRFLGKEVAQHVYDGMCSPVYNLGPGSLDWRWAKSIKNGDVARGADLLRTTGTTARGRTLAGLVRRRKEEALLLSKGIYTGIGEVAEAAPVTQDPMADGMLIRGESGKPVASLIRDLNMLGFYDGIMDDVFGHGTEAAVLDFQRAYELDADGIAGPVTLATIAAAVSEKKDGHQPLPTPKEEDAPAPTPAPEPSEKTADAHQPYSTAELWEIHTETAAELRRRMKNA